MSAQGTKTVADLDLAGTMALLGRRARAASQKLAIASGEQKLSALLAIADALGRSMETILAANEIDMEAARERGLSGSFLERLTLTPARVSAMIEAVKTVAALPDPVGATMAEWDVASGLHIERVRTPLGVIGVIFESRPNVAADAGALCLKSGNATILRGGSDSYYSVHAIHKAFEEGLRAAGLPAEAIQLVPTTDRQAVGEMLKGLDGNIDVIVPRGGAGLVSRIQAEARVPVFAHLEGICHVFVDKSADLEMSISVTLNSKMRRTSICGAAETLLVHKDAAKTHLPAIAAALAAVGCELRGDARVLELIEAKPAEEKDWHTEYNDAILSIAIVDDVGAAIEHIATYSSHHTEGIIAEDGAAVAKFFSEVDSAVLLHNASTQFSDGAEFGMGAEIGIATGKLHARGPVGVEQLTSFKYLVRGTGQTRP